MWSSLSEYLATSGIGAPYFLYSFEFLIYLVTQNMCCLKVNILGCYNHLPIMRPLIGFYFRQCRSIIETVARRVALGCRPKSPERLLVLAETVLAERVLEETFLGVERVLAEMGLVLANTFLRVEKQKGQRDPQSANIHHLGSHLELRKS